MRPVFQSVARSVNTHPGQYKDDQNLEVCLRFVNMKRHRATSYFFIRVMNLRSLFLVAACRLLIPEGRVSNTNLVTLMRAGRFVVHFVFVDYHVIAWSSLQDEFFKKEKV